MWLVGVAQKELGQILICCLNKLGLRCTFIPQPSWCGGLGARGTSKHRSPIVNLPALVVCRVPPNRRSQFAFQTEHAHCGTQRCKSQQKVYLLSPKEASRISTFGCNIARKCFQCFPPRRSNSIDFGPFKRPGFETPNPLWGVQWRVWVFHWKPQERLGKREASIALNLVPKERPNRLVEGMGSESGGVIGMIEAPGGKEGGRGGGAGVWWRDIGRSFGY